MISTLELRRVIEKSFRPLECQCTLMPGNSLQVRVTDPATGSVDLLVTGISTLTLDSSQAISELIAELQYDLSANKQKSLGGISSAL